jgi:hypothetical protein
MVIPSMLILSMPDAAGVDPEWSEPGVSVELLV